MTTSGRGRSAAVARFLRPPRTAGEWVADGVRVIALAGIVYAFVVMTPKDAGILALALPVVLVPRFVGVRVWFDVLFGVTVLVAAWSNVLDLYSRIAVWDIVVHFACTAVIAAMTYLVLARVHVVPAPPRARRRMPLVLVPTIGLAVSAVWEMIEWSGWRLISRDIFVSYQDTIGDMAAGGLGGVGAGVLVAFVPLLVPAEERATDVE